MPFDKIKPKELKSLKEAQNELIQIKTKTAFIAGGYIKDSVGIRNAIFLVHNGEIKGEYYKRRWGEGDPENLVLGTKAKLFKWEKFSCIPLICADVFDVPSKKGTEMMYEAIQMGASENTPIIVCSYGSGLQTPFWQVPLQSWSSGCECPVLICGVSGKSDKPIIVDGFEEYCGGGGSGVFWSDGVSPYQKSDSGIYIIDTKSRIEFRPLPAA
jgi:predicted amidohydrolase